MNQTVDAPGIAEWLDRYGLGQYADTFRQNDVDLTELRDLTESDLRELGMSLGHRKILRRAVGELTAISGQDSAKRESERRHLSVMFCDLVGSTVLAQSYDAEDLAEILRVYRTCCDEVVKSLEGIPLGKQGDGYVAVFGYPRAREDDAERAVVAALEIVARVQALRPIGDLVLHSRVAVSTGRVVIGDISSDDGAIAGSTLNLAARLQDVAEIDTVVLGPSTQRLVSGIARLEHRGLNVLKGFDEPIEAWRVLGMRDSDQRSRLGWRQAGSRLVGRDAEIERLHALWRSAASNHGRVAVISGDAGIGKSHLMEAFLDDIRDEAGTPLRFFCGERFGNTALWPVVAEIRRLAAFRDDDDPAMRIEKLERVFHIDPQLNIPLIASLLRLPLPDRYEALDLTTLQHKVATFAALESQLLSDAQDRPTLILFEDAHWSDPTTLEFLSHVAHQVVVDAPIMMIVTHRSGFDMGWPEDAHIDHIRLERLDESLSHEIVLRTAGQLALPVETIRAIIARADGVPLFIEELSRAVSESSVLNTESTPTRVDVPETLEDSLMARLDRLGKGKSLAQLAAVIGRRFSSVLLRLLSDLSENEFDEALHELEISGLAVPISGSDNEYLIFKHALVQQAAYSSLLRRQRQELHARIAEILAREKPDLATAEPETLAWHYAGAAMPAEATRFLSDAGRLAVSRAAHIEAINHFTAAIEQLQLLPDTADRGHQEVFLRALLGGALMSVRGFAAKEVHDAFARAHALCLELGESPMFCSASYGLLTVNASRSNREETVALASEMMAAFADCPVPSWSIAAHFAAAYVDLFQGDFDRANELFEKAIAQYTPDQHGSLMEQFGDNLAEFSLCYVSWIRFLRGDRIGSEEALARADSSGIETNNRGAQVRSAAFRMGQSKEVGDISDVEARAPEIIKLATDLGYPYWATAAQIGLGWSIAERGEADRGIDMIEAALGFFDLIGQKTPLTYWRTYLVDALIAGGQRDRALTVVNDALEQCRTGLDAFYMAELLCLKGQALWIEPADDVAAEACFEESIEWAAARGLALHVLYSTDRLTRLRIDQGRGAEMRAPLAAAIDAITSETDFPKLTAARALLETLR